MVSSLLEALTAEQSERVYADTSLDLDLEDIDASQLEDELNEPPEPEPLNDPVPVQMQTQTQNLGQSSYGQAPAVNNNGVYDHNAGGASGSGAGNNGPPAQAFGGFGGAVGGGGGNDGGLDRIKPNDMPDEGLVDRFLILYFTIYYVHSIQLGIRRSQSNTSSTIIDSDSGSRIRAYRKPSTSLVDVAAMASHRYPHISPGRPYKEIITDPMYYVLFKPNSDPVLLPFHTPLSPSLK